MRSSATTLEFWKVGGDVRRTLESLNEGAETGQQVHPFACIHVYICTCTSRQCAHPAKCSTSRSEISDVRAHLVDVDKRLDCTCLLRAHFKMSIHPWAARGRGPRGGGPRFINHLGPPQQPGLPRAPPLRRHVGPLAPIPARHKKTRARYLRLRLAPRPLMRPRSRMPGASRGGPRMSAQVLPPVTPYASSGSWTWNCPKACRAAKMGSARRQSTLAMVPVAHAFHFGLPQ